jgi:hypothetical protein
MVRVGVVNCGFNHVFFASPSSPPAGGGEKQAFDESITFNNREKHFFIDKGW